MCPCTLQTTQIMLTSVLALTSTMGSTAGVIALQLAAADQKASKVMGDPQVNWAGERARGLSGWWLRGPGELQLAPGCQGSRGALGRAKLKSCVISGLMHACFLATTVRTTVPALLDRCMHTKPE